MYPPPKKKRVYEVDQNRRKLPLPGGMPGGGMVTSQIEPCIVLFLFFLTVIYLTAEQLLFNHSIFCKPLIPCISMHFTILCSAIYSERFG